MRRSQSGEEAGAGAQVLRLEMLRRLPGTENQRVGLEGGKGSGPWL